MASMPADSRALLARSASTCEAKRSTTASLLRSRWLLYDATRLLGSTCILRLGKSTDLAQVLKWRREIPRLRRPTRSRNERGGKSQPAPLGKTGCCKVCEEA